MRLSLLLLCASVPGLALAQPPVEKLPRFETAQVVPTDKPPPPGALQVVPTDRPPPPGALPVVPTDKPPPPGAIILQPPGTAVPAEHGCGCTKKICVPECGTARKVDVVYRVRCVDYCLPKCSLWSLLKKGDCDCTACDKPRVYHVLIKRRVVEEKEVTRCAVREVPAEPDCKKCKKHCRGVSDDETRDEQ